MSFFNDRMAIVSDSLNNISLFRLVDGEIIQYYFDINTKYVSKKKIANKVFLEYNVAIDEENYIYLLYQDMSFNLILTLLKNGEIETIKLTEEPIPEVYNLDIIINEKEPHIFYCILLSKAENKYRIYHHYFNGVDWITNIVEEIKVAKLLNPMKIIKNDTKLILGYYDKEEEENIYIKNFDLKNKKWGEKLQLTNNPTQMLYIDFLLVKGKLHLTYCQYDGNIIVKYERFNYKDNLVEKEKEKILSNEENAQLPTLIFYEDKLWVVWIEYENIMSRYSTDNGTTWSPIYLWNESKTNDIIRYKYCDLSNERENILNYSFGKIYPHMTFVGFGPLENTTEIPLKKKTSLKILRH
jgi:hypothetical protein